MSDIDKTIRWPERWTNPYESEDLLRHKFFWLNGSASSSSRLSAADSLFFTSNSLQDRVPSNDLWKAIAPAARVCLKCLAGGYHTDVSQQTGYEFCPLHESPLVLPCSRCKMPQGFANHQGISSEPFVCGRCEFNLLPLAVRPAIDWMSIDQDLIREKFGPLAREARRGGAAAGGRWMLPPYESENALRSLFNHVTGLQCRDIDRPRSFADLSPKVHIVEHSVQLTDLECAFPNMLGAAIPTETEFMLRSFSCGERPVKIGRGANASARIHYNSRRSEVEFLFEDPLEKAILDLWAGVCRLPSRSRPRRSFLHEFADGLSPEKTHQAEVFLTALSVYQIIRFLPSMQAAARDLVRWALSNSEGTIDSWPAQSQFNFSFIRTAPPFEVCIPIDVSFLMPPARLRHSAGATFLDVYCLFPVQMAGKPQHKIGWESLPKT